MKIRKGDYGYIRREKKKRLLVTLGLFVLPAIVFIVGLVLADGNKSNIFTVVAVVGCLPGCRAAGYTVNPPSLDEILMRASQILARS